MKPVPSTSQTSLRNLGRRQLLQIAALAGAGAMSRPLLADAVSPATYVAPRAKHVIHIFLHGGAPTQDMFDMKPLAPAEVRGEFQPIATKVPGISICEHLPKMASWMDRCAIVRSVHHNAGCHNCLPSFTGSEQPVDINELIPRDTYPPGMGNVCEYLRPTQCEVPHFVALPTSLGWGFNLKRPGPWGGFLGSRFDPVLAQYEPAQNKDPAPDRQPIWIGAPKLAGAELPADITRERLDARRGLLSGLNGSALPGRAAEGLERTWRRAYGLLTEPKLRQAFDVSAEEAKTRESYGNSLLGNSALIARRLIEAGVRFVDLYFDGYSYKHNTGFDTYWDTHSNNFIQLKKANLPLLDQVFDALARDLDARGLLDETLIVINTDFGRTPRVNGNAGRDHWTSCYSVLFAGAGIRGGTLCGSSDAQAAYVKDRPVRPKDLVATVLHLLGIDPDSTLDDRQSRPIPVANGGLPIEEILA